MAELDAAEADAAELELPGSPPLRDDVAWLLEAAEELSGHIAQAMEAGAVIGGEPAARGGSAMGEAPNLPPACDRGRRVLAGIARGPPRAGGRSVVACMSVSGDRLPDVVESDHHAELGQVRAA